MQNADIVKKHLKEMVKFYKGVKWKMESKRQLTREELLEMESAPKTKMQHMLDVVICFCPYFAAIIMFLVYYLMPDAVQNFNPHVFTIVVCFFWHYIWSW